MKRWFCFLSVLSLALPLFGGCKTKPPQVAIHGPDEALAGTSVTFSAKVTPPEDGLTFSWSVDWLQDRAGSASCRPAVEDSTGASTKVAFPKDCRAESFRVALVVKARGGKVKASKTFKVIAIKKPQWPKALPSHWKILNDYENPGDPRANNWGGFFGTWGYQGGKCGIKYGDKSPEKLTITYAMHMGDSSCGTFEYLKGTRGKSEPVDISGYDRVAFLLKSGDDKVHRVRFEIVELDPYAATLQGYVGESELLTAGPEWKRYEVRLDNVLHPHFDRTKGKQVGLKLEHKNLEQPSGVVLLDNIAFIGKAEEKGSQ
ncbi:MAG: PKD domain-containing protein [Deltaproteobacteria bacterium]|nr:PKD domain-containing protein [Deltaproteobacteria bacterium]